MRNQENISRQILLGDNSDGEEQTRFAIGHPTSHSVSPTAEAPLIAVPRASGEESNQQRFHAPTPPRQCWLERYGGWIVIAFIASMAVYILTLNAQGNVPGRSFLLKSGSDLLQLAGEIIGFIFCLCSVARLHTDWTRIQQERKRRQSDVFGDLTDLSAQAHRARRAWLAWGFLALGIALYACGQAIWTSYDIRMPSSQVPFPGLYDVCFVASYPSFLIGTLLLTRRGRNIIGQACLALDALAVLGAAFALSWFFVLGPTIAALSGSFGAEFLSLYFPSSDLFLVAVAVLLMFSPLSQPSQHPVLLRLSLGLILLAVTDSLLGYFSLSPSGFNTGTLQDILWPLSMMCIGLAAIEYPRSVAREQALHAEYDGHLPGGVPDLGRFVQLGTIARTIVPFLLALLTSAVLLIEVSARGSIVLLQADLVALALMVIVVLRQALTMRETLLAQQVIEKNNRMLEQTNARLTSLATTDMLTGLMNHHTVQTQLEQACERACSSDRPLSLLFFDGDHFKQVNDTYGHAIGDVVLHELAERARSVLRSGDIVGRFGGEEFLALLPETDTSEARVVAERLRDAVAAAPLACSEVEHGIAITVSIGVASCPADGTNPNEIQGQADQAMYWAKRLGRNRVCTAAEAALANCDQQLKTATTHMLQRQELAVLDTCHPEQPLWAAQLGLIYALMGALDTREPGMSKHAHEMSDLVTALARALHFDEARTLRAATAAFLHDIGRIALPDRLTRQLEQYMPLQQRNILQQHAELGATIVEASPWLSELAPAIRHQCEWWDGTGVSGGLRGEAIPLEARLIALAGTYHAFLYEPRAARSVAEALAEVEFRSGTQIDPALLPVIQGVLYQQLEEQGEAPRKSTRHLASSAS